jgi:hypothetical protein
VGLIPLVGFFVYLGTSVSDIHEVVNGEHQMSVSEITVMVVGTVVAMIGLILTSVLVRRSLVSNKR